MSSARSLSVAQIRLIRMAIEDAIERGLSFQEFVARLHDILPAPARATEDVTERVVTLVAEREASLRTAAAAAAADTATAIKEAFCSDIDLPADVLMLVAAEQYREAFITWMDEQAKGDWSRWLTLLLLVWYQVNRGPWFALAAPEGREDA